MKSRAVRTVASSVVFLCMILASALLLRPVYGRMSAELRAQALRWGAFVEERYGVRLRYDSMSPSVLTGIRIRNLSVVDSQAGELLLRVRAVSFSYRLGALLRKDFGSAFGTLNLNGVEVEYDSASNAALLGRLAVLFPEARQASAQDAGFSLRLPFAVRIRNARLSCSAGSADVTASVRSIRLSQRMDSAYASAVADGTVFVREKVSGRGMSFAAGLQLRGEIARQISGSTARIRLSPAGRADYTAGDMEFLALYDGESVRLSSARSVQALSLTAQYELHERILAVQMRAVSLDPLSVVVPRNRSAAVSKVAGMRLDGDAAVVCSDSFGTVQYMAGMKARVPHAVPGGLAVSVRAQGDLDSVSFSELDAESALVSASYAGTFDLRALMPSGVAQVRRLSLPNGTDIMCDIYAEPQGDGVLCYMPQILLSRGSDARAVIDNQALLVPGDGSLDFSAELHDYSHGDFYELSDSGERASVRVSGSLMGGQDRRVQADVEVSNFFADSAMSVVSFFVPERAAALLRGKAEMLSGYIFAGELYFSLDSGGVSYNMPYVFAASTRGERQVIMLSADGSGTSLHVSNLGLLLGGNDIQVSSSVDFSARDRSALFDAALSVNSIPFSCSGSVADSWLSVSGDYGFSASVDFSDGIYGSLSFSGFPVQIGACIASFSADAGIFWPRGQDFSVGINSLRVSEPSGRFLYAPELALRGQVSPYGFTADSVRYTDSNSVLEGTASVLWNMDAGVFSGASVSLDIASSSGDERVLVDGTVSNPALLPFSRAAVLNDWYCSLRVEASSFCLSRFSRRWDARNAASAVLSASGTVADPYAVLEIRELSYMIGSAPARLSGTARVEDRRVIVDAAAVSWGSLAADPVRAEFSLADMSGDAHVELALTAAKSLFAPLDIHLEKGGGSEFVLSAVSENVHGNVLKSPVPFEMTLVHSDAGLSLYTGESIGISGFFLRDGSIWLSASGGAAPYSFDLSGTVRDRQLSLRLSDARIDMGAFSNLLDTPFFAVRGGVLGGGCEISGPVTDPEFNGEFHADRMIASVPMFVPDDMMSEHVAVSLEQKNIVVPDVLFSGRNGSVIVGIDLMLDRWLLDVLRVSVRSPRNSRVPVNVDERLFGVRGLAVGDMSIDVYMDHVDVRGDLLASNTEISLDRDILSPDAREMNSGGYGVRMDLKVTAGQKVRVSFADLLRGLVNPGTQVRLSLDTASEYFGIDGDISLRGGELFWLNRNFYMKEGRMVFSSADRTIDPYITVRAETKERDSDGNNVTISLSAANQRVSAFSPIYSAVPAKSENEIMALLGQFISGDAGSAGDVLLAGADAFTQMLVVRRLEDALRNMMNFDIFSVRTMVLQNAVRQGLNMSGAKESMSFSNYFDNSTVYIGKYFGNSMYVDSLLHWTYDEHADANDMFSVGKLVFRPEFGVQLEAPFATIRWNLAPDLSQSLESMFVSATSITLSWKFSF